jgi:GDP-L-fucose synthase
MNKKSKIYVAGHKGMIGSAICRALEKRGYANILTKSHKALDLTQQAKVERFFAKEKPDYVFLAAARVGGIHANNTYPAEFIYQNTMIQSNIIHSAWQQKTKKLFFLASSCVFPKKTSQPMREDSLMTGLMEPTNEPYGLAKLSGINLCQSYRRQYGCNFISVIPANTYGMNDHFDENGHVLAALIGKFHSAKTKGDAEVSLWGSGKPKREFLYADDLADACLFLMKKYNAPEVINIGTGRETSIKQLAQHIAKITDFKGKLVFDTSKPDGNPRRLVDSSRIHDLGWKAKTALEDGLEKTYRWYQETLTHS